MSEQVSTFLPIQIGNKSYLFFMITWNDYVTNVGEELDKQFEAFGEDLGPTGKVIRSYKSAARESFNEVMKMNWPSEIRERFDSVQEPFMLVINKNFDTFSPESDQWGIVWFSNFYEKPDSIYRLFGALAKKVRRKEDLFAFLRDISAKEKYKKWGRYFELKKPEIFGVSIDVEAIVEDIMGVKRTQ